jgi:hypothetical protein
VVLAQGTNDLSQAVPLLADLLSIPTGDRYPKLDLKDLVIRAANDHPTSGCRTF